MASETKIGDGGPAFPVAVPADFNWANAGMSLRDHFAGQALAGLCANPGGPFQANELNGWALVNCNVNYVAALAYELADAMLEARALSAPEKAGEEVDHG